MGSRLVGVRGRVRVRVRVRLRVRIRVWIWIRVRVRVYEKDSQWGLAVPKRDIDRHRALYLRYISPISPLYLAVPKRRIDGDPAAALARPQQQLHHLRVRVRVRVRGRGRGSRGA